MAKHISPIQTPIMRISTVLLLAGLLFFSPQGSSGKTASPSFGSGLTICEPPVYPVTLSSPTIITNCTRQSLQEALDQGGQITFDCGPNPVTIPIDSTLDLNPTVDTVLDGGGLVTLDGLSQNRILNKEWHNPALSDIHITLQNIRLVNGKAPSGVSTGDHSGGALKAGHPGTHINIINSTFENNSTRDTTTPDNQGGAIFVHNVYQTVISGSRFEGNLAGNGGAFGGIATGLVVFNSQFIDNQAVDASLGDIVRGYGGAIHLDGVSNRYNPDSSNRMHVCGSVFESNTSIRGGGAMGVVISDNLGTKAIYERSTFTGNRTLGVDSSFGQGGAIYHIEDDHSGGTAEDNLEISHSTFQGNQAGRQGGGAWQSCQQHL